MIQLLFHLWGDYLTQSDWMAQNKTKASLPAFIHALLYSLPFLLLKPSAIAFAVIFVTHFFIDRFRLARYVVWAKNWMAPRYIGMNDQGRIYQVHNLPFWRCAKTGYLPDSPDWLAFWLLIIADNTLHLTCNYLALRFL